MARRRTVFMEAERVRASRNGAIRLCIVVAAVVMAAGCATQLRQPGVSTDAVERERFEQQKLAVQMAIDRQVRVWGVGHRLRRAGADLCGSDVRYSFGFFAVGRDMFPDEMHAAVAALGVEDGVVVWSVLADGPANGELQEGDRIVRVQDRAVDGVEEFIKAARDPFETGDMSLRVGGADGTSRDLVLRGIKICEYPVAVIDDDSVNAMADGSRVIITNGMVRFAESNDQLALVVGHEIAHNSLGHITQMRAQTAIGVLADLAVTVFTGVSTSLFTELARRAFSQEMEADADYMGLYLASRAGYEIRNASMFWRRMAIEHPGSIRGSMLSTHPSSPERAVMLDRTVEEIEEKRRRGEALIPHEQ